MKSDKMTNEEFVPFAVEIIVSSLEDSLKFYKDVMGFELHRIDEPYNFAVFKFNNTIFMMRKDENIKKPDGRVIMLRFILPNLEEYFKQVQSKGAKITKPIEKMSYGLRRFYIEDPDGYQLKFAE